MRRRRTPTHLIVLERCALRTPRRENLKMNISLIYSFFSFFLLFPFVQCDAMRRTLHRIGVLLESNRDATELRRRLEQPGMRVQRASRDLASHSPLRESCVARSQLPRCLHQPGQRPQRSSHLRSVRVASWSCTADKLVLMSIVFVERLLRTCERST